GMLNRATCMVWKSSGHTCSTTRPSCRAISALIRTCSSAWTSSRVWMILKRPTENAATRLQLPAKTARGRYTTRRRWPTPA
ncbi:hypothetical protein LPJ67_006383, partial [Coemansia sp. RSA 1938]